MQLPIFVADDIGWLAYQFAEIQPYIPTYTHLIASALFPIYAGAHASLSRPSSAAKRLKRERADEKAIATDEEDVDEEEEDKQLEGLSPVDAIMFPVLAGCTLAGLYMIIKWLNNLALLNKLLNYYFATFGVFSVARMASDGLDVFHSMLFPHHYVDAGVIYTVKPKERLALPSTGPPRVSALPSFFSRIPLPKFLHTIFWTAYILPNQRLTVRSSLRGVYNTSFRLGIHGVEGLVIGLASVAYFNFVSKPWWLTNVMGFGFAYGALQLMSPTTFWTGTLILSGLFFYDIYFVFYTPMMITVAKSLDIPIKLLFPRPSPPGADPTIQALSMLGLGDVVLPGIMIGLALRFDLFLFYQRKQRRSDGEKLARAPYVSVAETLGDRFWTSRLLFANVPAGFVPRGVFPKTYFNAGLLGYVVGMVATLGAMQISDHPQPALLYLVPCVLASLWGTAWARGEIREMWNFSEAADEDVPKEDGGNGKVGGKEEHASAETKTDVSDTGASTGASQGEGSQRKEKERFFTFSIALPPIARGSLKGSSSTSSEEGGETSAAVGRSSSAQTVDARSDEHLQKRRRVG